jgi:hypothetical protein
MSTYEYGKAAIRLSLLQDGSIEKALNSVEARFEKFGKKLISIGKSFTVVGAAIIAPFIAGLKAFTDYGSTLNGISKRTGVSIEALQQLGFAAEQSGSSLEGLGDALLSMHKIMFKASVGQKKALVFFHALHLDVKKLLALSPEEQFLAIADAISQLNDDSKEAAISEGIFGGPELINFLKKGAAGIRELMNVSHQTGQELSKEDAEAASKFKYALLRLWESVKKVSMQLGLVIVGPLTQFVNKIQPIVAAISGWINKHKTLFGLIAGFGGTLLAIGTAINFVRLTVLATAVSVKALKKYIFDLNSAENVLIWTSTKLAAVYAFLSALDPFVWAIIAAYALAALIVYIEYTTHAFSKLFHCIDQFFADALDMGGYGKYLFGWLPDVYKWLAKLTETTDDATKSTDAYADALDGVTPPDSILDKIKSALGIDLDSMSKSSHSMEVQSFFDTSLARQTIGDTTIPAQQLAVLKSIDKGVSQIRPGLLVI